MESTDSSTGSQLPQLPPGFRFHPTDEELVVHYLKKRATAAPLPVAIIADIDLYKFDPWDLPSKATFGEQEWYFFSPRERKYPNGARPNRAANSGYWKATGTDKPVMTSGGTQKVGVKKALVFYGGKPPKGVKTNWIMHEYRLTDGKTMIAKPHGSDPTKQKRSSRLDDYVLCRIYKKNSMQRPTDNDGGDIYNHGMNGLLSSIPSSISLAGGHRGMVENQEHNLLFDVRMNLNELASPNTNTSIGNLLPAKRSLSDVFWSEDAAVSTAVANSDVSGSMASLLSQLQETPQLQPQTMVGSVEDGVFRQPYQLPDMNWYS